MNWGMSTAIDLHGCNPKIIRSSKQIKLFVFELCNLLQVKMFGKTIVVNFGQDPRVSGYSMMQLIETSSITAHFVNQTNSVYLDIFSCKEYDAQVALEFSKQYFEAKTVKASVTMRP